MSRQRSRSAYVAWVFTALACALAIGYARPVSAQLIHLAPPASEGSESPDEGPDTGPEEVGPDPSSADAAERGRPPEPDDPSASPDADASDRVLLPLRLFTPEADAAGAPRLSGEVALKRFTLFLPASPGPTQIRIAHRSGIDVLPEMSRLVVVVNGTPVGSLTPDSFDGFAATVLDVPDGILQAGQNNVEITARHSHRIACGPEAAFALWTEIDTNASGVMIPLETLEPGPLSFLAALSAQVARGAPVTIRRSDPAAPLDDAAPFIARVVTALGGTPPTIRSASYWAPSDAGPELARITAFEPGMDPDTPRFARGGDGAIVLLVERDSAYADISALLMSSAGMTMPQQVPQLTPGTASRLDDLGAPVLRAEGRYALLPVQFRLPSDWLLLASQRALLELDYRIAPGLPEGALMLIKVNGTTVRLLPMDRDGGMTLPTLPVRFQAALLRPGINRLEFEIFVPGDPPNMACPPMVGLILDVLPTSRLFVPAAPAMTMPSLDLALERVPTNAILLTESAADRLPPGFVPQLAAALSLGARNPVEGASLTVGTVADIDRFPGRFLSQAAGSLVEVLRHDLRPTDPAATLASPDGSDSARPDLDASSPDGDVSGPARLVDSLYRASSRMVRGDDPGLAEWLEGRSARAALLQPDPEDENSLWLIVGAGGAPSDVASALAASRTSADGPRGQVALYMPGTGWESWTAPDRPLRLLEPLDATSLRAVMGNYATHAPLGFVAVVLALTGLSAMVAISILLVTRRGRG